MKNKKVKLNDFLKKVSKGHKKGEMLLSDCEKLVKIINIFQRYEKQAERDCLDVTICDIISEEKIKN